MEAKDIITFPERRKRKVKVDHLGHSVWVGEITDRDLQLLDEELSVAEPEESFNPYDRVGKQLRPAATETV